MGNQGQQVNPGQQSGRPGNRDREREGNLGQSGSDMHKPTGTSGQPSERKDQPDRGNQQNQDEEDSGIGNRSTNR